MLGVCERSNSQGLMVTDAWPWTCRRAGQSRVAITLLVPALCGVKYSVQVREEPPMTNLRKDKHVKNIKARRRIL